MKTARPKYLGIKLSKDEMEALVIWADSLGVSKSVMARRAIRMAMRKEARDFLTPNQLSALNIKSEK